MFLSVDKAHGYIFAIGHTIFTAILIPLTIYYVHHLVNGYWTLRRYIFRVAYLFYPLTFIWFGVIVYFYVEYSLFGFLIYVGGTINGIGLLRVKQYLLTLAYITAGMIIGFFCEPGLLQIKYPQYILALVGLFAFLMFAGASSRQFISVNAANSKLLRRSRIDKRTISEERKKTDRLLLSILPAAIAEELKSKQSVEPVHFDSATILFTDFQGFTSIAERMTPRDLVSELDLCFSYFDSLMNRFQLEKLKTIGDSFMCAGGLPQPNRTHAIDCVLAALEIQRFMNTMKDLKKKQGFPYWELRLGIHSGPLIAGVIGHKKFAYDVWGDTVNTASRLESSGLPGKVNISAATYALVQDFFACEYRGKVDAKNKGPIDMYFVTGLRPEYSRNGDGQVPNEDFAARRLTAGAENPS